MTCQLLKLSKNKSCSTFMKTGDDQHEAEEYSLKMILKIKRKRGHLLIKVIIKINKTT